MIITDNNNEKWVVKFKYPEVNREIATMHGRREAVISYNKKYTVCGIRNIKDSHDDYVNVVVPCSDADVFKKTIGRKYAFLKAIKLLRLDREAFINTYNSFFRDKIRTEDLKKLQTAEEKRVAEVKKEKQATCEDKAPVSAVLLVTHAN